ncbi:MAG: hypothetical protein Q9193_003179 [Seirophora villosa]
MTNTSPPNDRSLPLSTLQLYSATSLRESHADLLLPLTALINLCYSVSHTSSPHGILLPYSYQRLSTQASFLDEVGVEGFTFIMSIQTLEGEQVPIASASAKPFKELGHHEVMQGSELLREFKRKAAPGLDPTSRFEAIKDCDSTETQEALNSLRADITLPKWEIICNVVHPNYQKRGLAAEMYNALIEEMRRREPEPKRIHLVITTMKELREAYYQKRGFVTTGEKRFGKGVGGSEVGFSVVEMEQMV